MRAVREALKPHLQNDADLDPLETDTWAESWSILRGKESQAIEGLTVFQTCLSNQSAVSLHLAHCLCLRLSASEL